MSSVHCCYCGRETTREQARGTWQFVADVGEDVVDELWQCDQCITATHFEDLVDDEAHMVICDRESHPLRTCMLLIMAVFAFIIVVLVVTPECSGQDCPDLNGDGHVNITELTAVLGAWGPCDDEPEEFQDSDLSGDVDVVLRPGVVYEISESIRLRGTSLTSTGSVRRGPNGAPLDDTRAVVRWTGSKTGTVVIAENASIDGIVFTSVHESARHQAPRFVQVQGETTTITSCDFDRCDDAINCESAEAVGRIADVRVVNPGGHGIWLAGSGGLVESSFLIGSVGERPLRTAAGSGASGWVIRRNLLIDGGKGAMWVRGDDCIVYDNQLIGHLSIGPNESSSDSDVGRRTRDVVVRGNTIDGGVRLSSGTLGCVVELNTITANGGSAIVFSGWRGPEQRRASGVLVVDNVLMNSHTRGRALEITEIPTSSVVRGNRYIAPSLETGSHKTANVYALADSIDGIEFEANTWALPAVIGWGGGMHYVWPYWSHRDGYRDADEWDALDQVLGAETYVNDSIE